VPCPCVMCCAAVPQELLLRLRFNAHPLSIMGGAVSVLGVFPAACFLNHSCRPNAALALAVHPHAKTKLMLQARTHAHVDLGMLPKHGPPVVPCCAEGRRGCLDGVQVRATRHIRGGEALCYSYLSRLEGGREERRELLLKSFLFQCRCQRCEEEAKGGEGTLGSDGTLLCPCCARPVEQEEGTHGSCMKCARELCR
jgi:hypothetical protein